MEQLPLANGSFREARSTAALLTHTQHKEGSVNLSLFCFNNSLCQEWNQHIIAFFLLDIYAKTICATSATPHILLIVRLHAREPSPSAPHIRVKLPQKNWEPKIHSYLCSKQIIACSRLFYDAHTPQSGLHFGFSTQKANAGGVLNELFWPMRVLRLFFFALRDGTRSRHG
jgi:hypothetical protein